VTCNYKWRGDSWRGFCDTKSLAT